MNTSKTPSGKAVTETVGAMGSNPIPRTQRTNMKSNFLERLLVNLILGALALIVVLTIVPINPGTQANIFLGLGVLTLAIVGAINGKNNS